MNVVVRVISEHRSLYSFPAQLHNHMLYAGRCYAVASHLPVSMNVRRTSDSGRCLTGGGQ